MISKITGWPPVASVDCQNQKYIWYHLWHTITHFWTTIVGDLVLINVALLEHNDNIYPLVFTYLSIVLAFCISLVQTTYDLILKTYDAAKREILVFQFSKIKIAVLGAKSWSSLTRWTTIPGVLFRSFGRPSWGILFASSRSWPGPRSFFSEFLFPVNLLTTLNLKGCHIYRLITWTWRLTRG